MNTSFNCLCCAVITFSLSYQLPAQPVSQSRSVEEQVDSFIDLRMKTYHIPGATVAISRNGKVIYQKGYGFANVEMALPASPETNYLIASVTKTFTATAVMMLWEQGLVQLDDPIGKYLGNIPDHWKPVTILQLLNHTSGIVSNNDAPGTRCKFVYDCEHYTQANVIQETACLPLEFAPGTKWKYSGRGYWLLGMLIEKVSSKSFGDFLTHRIFAPLGMSATRMINYNDLIRQRAGGYVVAGDSVQNAVHLNPVVEFSDGGLMSTVGDLAIWDASFNTEKLIKRSTRDMMWTKGKLKNGNEVSAYGIGFGVTPFNGHRRVGHNGGIPGFSSTISRFPDDQITVILLTNVTNEKLNIGEMGNQVAAFYLR